MVPHLRAKSICSARLSWLRYAIRMFIAQSLPRGKPLRKRNRNPQVIYLQVTYGCNTQMDKFETRRLALKRLTEGLGHGGIARVASAIGKEPNYVSRMLYEEGKKGRKRIGEDSADKLSAAFPEWLDCVNTTHEVASTSFQTASTYVGTQATDVASDQTLVYPLEQGKSRKEDYTIKQQSDTTYPILVPEVVQWDQLGVALSKKSSGGIYQALAIPGQFGPNVQVISYPDDSLEPEIQSGELIAVEPGLEPWPGDIVLARGKATGQYFAGRFVSNRSGGYKIRSNKPDRYADADHNDADVVAVMVARLSGRAGTPPVSIQGF